MNEHEAQRIASAISRARPDWPERQVLTLINEHLRDRPRRDVFVALAWIASERESTTPYRVLEAGPWWRAVAVDGDTTGRRDPYDPTTACDVCSRPEHRHGPHDEHRFESRHDADRRRAHEQPKERLPRRQETHA